MQPPEEHVILVVEDEESIRHVLATTLSDRGYRVLTAGSAEAARELLGEIEPAVALLDIVLPGMSGLQLLSWLKRSRPDIEVVIMTSNASVETAIEAIRAGAYDYLEKPFEDLDQVWMTVDRALEKRNLSIQNRALLQDQDRGTRELIATVMRMSSLIDAGCAMGEFRSLPELLDFFITLVAKELEVDRISLMLLDEDAGQLRIAASQGVDDVDVDTIRVALGEGIAGSVALNGEPFLVTNHHVVSEPVPGSPLASALTSDPIALSMPIKAREKVLGVINVTERRTGSPFRSEDLGYLSGLTGQLAVAIEGASHMDKLQQAYHSLKLAQDQLVFSERIKAIGQMAAGVAHDFNNVLSVIVARTQLVLSGLERDPIDVPTISRDLRTIKMVSLQGAEAIKRIQDYTRIRKDLPERAIDLNEVVGDAVEITRPKWMGECQAQGREVEVRFEPGEVSPVSGNVHELGQVIGNLIFNAVEAMPEGGLLTFRTFEEDGWACLSVSDTGVGMDEESQERLFEPFFTTKEDGQGLGTSIIYGIIARHGGEITVSSRRDEGTTFRVRLPVFRGGEARPPEAAPRIARPFRPVRVLIVEDDDLVRETYEDALSAVGHDVVATPNGDAGVAAFGEGTFDVVLTDLSMSGMSGLEVAREVKRLNASVPVILVSGWAIQQDEESLQRAGVDRVVAKPCQIDDLVDAVQQAVESAEPSAVTIP